MVAKCEVEHRECLKAKTNIVTLVIQQDSILATMFSKQINQNEALISLVNLDVVKI